MSKKILITAFEPFGKSPLNSSLELAKHLAELRGIPYEVLPVSYSRVSGELDRILASYRPDILLMLGQAGGDREIRLENVAINQRDVNLADLDGYVAIRERIDPDLPMAIFTDAPVCELRDKIRAQGIPAKRSNTAGLFVCNNAFFYALGRAKMQYPALETLFVHLPILPEQSESYPERFTMSLEDMTQALTIILDYYQG